MRGRAALILRAGVPGRRGRCRRGDDGSARGGTGSAPAPCCVEHGVAVQPRPGHGSVHHPSGRYRRDRPRGDQCHPGPDRVHGEPLRLFLRLPDGVDRARSQRRPDGASKPSGRPLSSRPPASPSAAPCGPPCTARSRWRVWRRRRRQRWPSPTTACSPPGRTTSPTTTTAGRSSSSGTRRARPC